MCTSDLDVMDNARSEENKKMTSSRPEMQGYGVLGDDEGSGLMPWSHVVDKMTAVRNYWVAKVTPENRPHVTPVWGLWHDEHFYFASGSDSRKARILIAKPSIVVHLESGEEVVIVVVNVGLLGDKDLMSVLDEAYYQKYTVRLAGNPTYRVTLSKVFAWSEADFPGSVTRWVFKE